MYQSFDEQDDRFVEVPTPIEPSERDYFLKCYQLFSTVTAICLACVMVTSSFLLMIDTNVLTMIDFAYLVLCLYSLIFVSIAFLCEMEWLETIRQSAIFQNWVFRGIFYSYLGIFTYVEYGRAKVFALDVGWVVQSIAALLTVLGFIYTIMVSWRILKYRSMRLRKL